jgi:hypothetical protein
MPLCWMFYIASLGSPVACKLNWLNYTIMDCPEHYNFFSVFAVVVSRRASVRISAIRWGIRVTGGGIRCRTKERPSRCVFRPVRVRRRCARRRPPSWTWCCEEIEVWGPNCDCQWDIGIVFRGFLPVIQMAKGLCASSLARARARACFFRLRADLGWIEPNTIHCFFFSFYW